MAGSGRRPLTGAFAALAATALLAVACADAGRADARREVRFWGLGREGEVVKELVPEFERRHPEIRIVVQQIPWTAAHEKLLTGFVGGSPPDLAQLGNTWIPEFAAIDALEPLEERIAASTALAANAYFEGVWKSNLFEGKTWGIPWYVDTRVLYYRPDLLEAAGYPEAPRTWSAWRDAMEKVAAGTEARYAFLLPTNEWEQLTILGVQRGATLLSEEDTRGDFSGEEFSAAAEWYVGLFRDGLAPVVSYTQLGNPYQEFARGYFAMWMTGPWNLGEFRRRLPPSEQHLWMTAPLPAPDGSPVWPGLSMAGGSSLAIFRASEEKDAAWLFAEYLSEPAVQLRFYALSGDLPARLEAWEDASLAGDAKTRAFRSQLARAAPMPRVPEWEQIAQKIPEDLEPAIRGRIPVSEALARLDRNVDRILEKRRWILERRKAANGP